MSILLESRPTGAAWENLNEHIDLAPCERGADPVRHSLHRISAVISLAFPHALVDLVDGDQRDRRLRGARQVWTVVQGVVGEADAHVARPVCEGAALVVSESLP